MNNEYNGEYKHPKLPNSSYFKRLSGKKNNTNINRTCKTTRDIAFYK